MGLDLRELADELADLEDEAEGLGEGESLDEDDAERLAALRSLQDDLGGDMRLAARDDAGLIHENEWEDYCRELASDLGYLEGDDKNPLLNYIDWERWAEDCKQDYCEHEFDGETYYRRSS